MTTHEYDDLTDDDKARLLLKLESFTGLLPRPRTVRMSTLAAIKKRTLSIENVELELMLAEAVYTTQQYTRCRMGDNNNMTIHKVLGRHCCC